MNCRNILGSSLVSNGAGNYLVIQGTQVDEVTPENTVVWTYNVDETNKELMGAQRLADGSTLVTECGENPRLVEVSSDGKIVAEIPLQPEQENSHMQVTTLSSCAEDFLFVLC